MQADSAFTEALDRLLKIESGPSNHAWDPGGDTAYGIAKAYWPQYWEDGPPTYEGAKVFYMREFWVPLNLPKIREQALRMEIFEAAVNCGLGTGAKFAQRAYNLLRPRAWVELLVDGDIGPKTTAALNRMTIAYLNALLAGCNFYQAQHYADTREELRDHAIRGWFAKRLVWSAE